MRTETARPSPESARPPREANPVRLPAPRTRIAGADDPLLCDLGVWRLWRPAPELPARWVRGTASNQETTP